MKTLLFTALVMGSVTYLVATQSELLHGWIDGVKPQAQQVVSEGQNKLDQLFEKTKEVTSDLSDTELVTKLKSSVSELKEDVKRLTNELNKNAAKRTEADEIRTEAAEYVNETMTKDDNTPLNETINDQPDAASPYMPVKERSDALMALVNRMEMKAAGF